ncbi:hypothetical protein SRHO_G00028450 [Serrasalmus rhombeus]
MKLLQDQALVVVLAKAIKRAVYVMCLVLFIMYIFAVAGVLYFGEQATGDTEHWGDLGSALLTVFGLITVSFTEASAITCNVYLENITI